MSKRLDILKVLDNPEKLQEIGSKIVREAASRAIMQKTQAGNAKPSLVIKKGEFVPESFRAKLNIKVDREGRALETWPLDNTSSYLEVCYIDDGGGYYECWAEEWEDVITGRIDRDVLSKHITANVVIPRDVLNKNFSPEEINMLKKYKLIDA